MADEAVGLNTRGALLDQLMAASWPAATVEAHGGWAFRHTAGVTRRANSVLISDEVPDIDEAIAAAEDFYRRRGASSTFMVSDASCPPEVVVGLESAGYVAQSPTWILAADADEIDLASPQPSSNWVAEVAQAASDSWFDCYWAVESGRHQPTAIEVYRNQLLKPDAPARFVTVTRSGQPVAVGQVVVVGGWGCVQCLATSTTARRQGAGRAVLNELVAQSAELGARGLFAAVMVDNDASLALCTGVGLRRAHQYRYYLGPLG